MPTLIVGIARATWVHTEVISTDQSLSSGSAQDDRNVLLDEVARMVSDFLRQDGYALRAAVETRFLTSPRRSCGVAVRVWLEDPRDAADADAALARRFADHLSSVTVR